LKAESYNNVFGSRPTNGDEILAKVRSFRNFPFSRTEMPIFWGAFDDHGGTPRRTVSVLD
jgi:hypothetical protein